MKRFLNLSTSPRRRWSPPSRTALLAAGLSAFTSCVTEASCLSMRPAVCSRILSAAATITLVVTILWAGSVPAGAHSLIRLARRHHDTPPPVIPTTHFKLTYEPGLEGSTEKFQAWLETARQRADETLGFLPIFPVGVTLCSTPEQYHRLGGRDVAAGAVVRSGLLVLVNETQPENTATAIDRVYLRYAIGQVTGRRAAPWLVEGIEQSHTV
ncbi:MAG: hypothetical protein M3Y56_03130, partial [Armatimonadota bacterium]|nr:hypothetical protein [Armatimonadota bacterium]